MIYLRKLSKQQNCTLFIVPNVITRTYMPKYSTKQPSTNMISWRALTIIHKSSRKNIQTLSSKSIFFQFWKLIHITKVSFFWFPHTPPSWMSMPGRNADSRKSKWCKLLSISWKRYMGLFLLVTSIEIWGLNTLPCIKIAGNFKVSF